jgi:hypothetical protein
MCSRPALPRGCGAVRPNTSLKRGPPPANHLGREALTVYAVPRGPGALPQGSA